LQLFPAFGSQLGYLKARADLADKGFAPDSASYTLKAALAAYSAFESSRILLVNLLQNPTLATEQDNEKFEKVLLAQMTQLDFYLGLLDQKDRLVLQAVLPQEPEK
jgi:hypothetical protein